METHRPGQEIAGHLPHLRRYARALFGSQDRGDRYVRVCLEALLAEPDKFTRAASPRVELFKLFHDTWTRITEPLEYNGELGTHPVDELEAQILSLPPRARQILLLTALEGFSIDEAADILGIRHAVAETLLTAAREELSHQQATRVLIIEDEPVIAVDIAVTLTEMGHIVVGTAATKDEAVTAATLKRPGIILADIKLGDGSSGIDAVADILDAMNVPVVFVTAYPEELLTGERREPAYLVTKPFEPDVLKVTVYQALLAQRQPVAARDAS